MPTLSVLPQFASEEPLANEHEALELQTVRGVSRSNSSDGVVNVSVGDYAIASLDSDNDWSSYVGGAVNYLPPDIQRPTGSPSRLRDDNAGGDVAESAV